MPAEPLAGKTLIALLDQQAVERDKCYSVRFTSQIGKRSQNGDVLVVNGRRVGVNDEFATTE